MEFNKTCYVCGKSFVAHSGNALYCLDCRYKSIRERDNRKQMERRHYEAAERKKVAPVQSVQEVSAKARDAGMTYGKYVARHG